MNTLISQDKADDNSAILEVRSGMWMVSWMRELNIWVL